MLNCSSLFLVFKSPKPLSIFKSLHTFSAPPTYTTSTSKLKRIKRVAHKAHTPTLDGWINFWFDILCFWTMFYIWSLNRFWLIIWLCSNCLYRLWMIEFILLSTYLNASLIKPSMWLDEYIEWLYWFWSECWMWNFT